MIVQPGVLAAPTGEAAKAGPIALAVILLLAIACYFLFRSMSKHLRRVRDEFPTDGRERPPEPGREGPAPPGPGREGPAPTEPGREGPRGPGREDVPPPADGNGTAERKPPGQL